MGHFGKTFYKVIRGREQREVFQQEADGISPLANLKSY